MPKLKFLKSSLLSFGMLVAATFGAHALDGDAEKGKNVFKKCASCHMVGPEAKNRVGPVLNDLIGRTAGAFPDYKFGKSIIKAGEEGLAWTEEEIFAYLENPKKYLRAKLGDKKAKSKMSFKLKKEDQRADVIAYLKTFSTAPENAEEEGAESDEVSTEATVSESESSTEETTTTD